MKVATFRALVSSRWSVFRPALRGFLGNRRGSIAIYVGFVITALMGASVIVFDIGRLGIARTQVQNAADAAAMGAAVQLDGLAGARVRAEAVARDAAAQTSRITTTTSGDAIVVDTVEFSQSTTAMVAATTDADAVAVRVTIVPRPIDLVLEPVLAMLTGATAQGFTNITADATATSSPIMCNPATILLCNPAEDGLLDITITSAAAGRQVLIRDSGNQDRYTLMCPPGAPNCSGGGVEANLAADDGAFDGCSVEGQATKPPSTQKRVNDALNARFDLGPMADPARNIVEYPRDTGFQNNHVGNGNWNRNQYWSDEHGGAPWPGDLIGASRYQTHLYELGESFARYGRQTIYPLPDDVGTLPSGYTVVTPLGEDIPPNGVPASTPSTFLKRRVLKAVVVDCAANGLPGRTDVLNVPGMKSVEVFVTEITGTGGDKEILFEIVGTLTSANSSDIIANVRLLD